MFCCSSLTESEVLASVLNPFWLISSSPIRTLLTNATLPSHASGKHGRLGTKQRYLSSHNLSETNIIERLNDYDFPKTCKCICLRICFKWPGKSEGPFIPFTAFMHYTIHYNENTTKISAIKNLKHLPKSRVAGLLKNINTGRTCSPLYINANYQQVLYELS